MFNDMPYTTNNTDILLTRLPRLAKRFINH
jgi:hypothetical protein